MSSVQNDPLGRQGIVAVSYLELLGSWQDRCWKQREASDDCIASLGIRGWKAKQECRKARNANCKWEPKILLPGMHLNSVLEGLIVFSLYKMLWLVSVPSEMMGFAPPPFF